MDVPPLESFLRKVGFTLIARENYIDYELRVHATAEDEICNAEYISQICVSLRMRIVSFHPGSAFPAMLFCIAWIFEADRGYPPKNKTIPRLLLA